MSARLDPMWENVTAPLPWMEKASCAGLDPEIFFRVGGHGAASMDIIDKARAICSWCHVKAECLEYALADTSIEGVWAGTTTRERRRMRTERKAAGDE